MSLSNFSSTDRYKTGSNRFFAGIIDGFIFLPYNWFNDWFSSSLSTPLSIAAWTAFSIQIYWLYSVFMHASYGQTFGKMAMGVHVVDQSETRGITLKQALIRDSIPIAINLVSATIFVVQTLSSTLTQATSENIYTAVSLAALSWFLLEIITMFTNKKRRALHDFMAGTVVIIRS